MTDQVIKIMDDIIENMDNVKNEWDMLNHRYTKAGAVRLRKSLDEIAKKKVYLRKAMIEQERK